MCQSDVDEGGCVNLMWMRSGASDDLQVISVNHYSMKDFLLSFGISLSSVDIENHITRGCCDQLA